MEKIESERLGFRKFDKSDGLNLYSLDSNPEVMKYLTDGITFDLEQSKKRLFKIIGEYETLHPYGVWVVEKKSTGQFIGWIMLKPFPNFSDPEVGYRFIEEFWGQGFATESAMAATQYGFKTLGLKKVLSITNPENYVSIKVLENAGFKYSRTISFFNSALGKEVPAKLFSKCRS